MSERLPPAIAIFFSEALRRRTMARLGSRVQSLRYDPAATIQSAFVEELSQAMAKAAERLRADVAPALAVVLVADPAVAAPSGDVVALVRKACPANVAVMLQWVGVHREAERWPREGVAFLLSTIWRGGLIQGGSLERAYQALVLSVLATETSRVAPEEFDCFARLRFHSAGARYQVGVDPFEVPDFGRQAEAMLRRSVLAQYFPEIDSSAREAAARRAPVELELQSTGSRAVLEPKLAEPLLCAALSQSVTVAQAAALLGDWAVGAAAPVAELLTDLRIAVTHWAAEAASVEGAAADLALARPLFALGGFPLLHELKMRVTANRTEVAFRSEYARVRAALIAQKRAELDREFYELLPGDLNAQQRLAIAAEQARCNGGATRLTVTRHFPADLIQDTREEILDLRDLSTVLYSLELRPE